jgi:hypothetical protein
MGEVTGSKTQEYHQHFRTTRRQFKPGFVEFGYHRLRRSETVPCRHQNRALHLREIAHSCDSPGAANHGLVAGRTNRAAELPIDSCSSRAQERRRAQSPPAKWVTGTPTPSPVTSRLNSQSNVVIRDHFVASAPTDNLGQIERLHFASAVESSPKVQRRQGRRETRARHAEVWV